MDQVTVTVGIVTRKESVVIKLSVPVTRENEKFLNTQAKLFGMHSTVFSGDTFNLTYNFDINYLNSIDSRLDSILHLIDTVDIEIKSVSCEELNFERILLKSILDKIDTLSRKLEDIPKKKGKR
jgi:hypothetical protein